MYFGMHKQFEEVVKLHGKKKKVSRTTKKQKLSYRPWVTMYFGLTINKYIQLSCFFYQKSINNQVINAFLYQQYNMANNKCI